MMTTSTSSSVPVEVPEYVLGTDQVESARLGLQHRLWSEFSHRLWERAGIQPGHVVLDLGCGPGHATIDLAQIVGPTGMVIGLDESATFLKQLNDQVQARRTRNVERVLGDVQELEEAFPGEKDTLDVAYARWVFCFLSRPERAIDGLAKLIRPNGKLVVQDYFNYDRSMTLAPRREAFTRVINAIGASWRSRGGDTDIMGKLPSMLVARGFRIDHLDVVQRIARPGSTLWHWPQSFWKTFLPRLVETGFVSAEDQAAFEAAWEQASRDPATFMQLPPVYELIATRL